ncbi:MAG: rod shape-determining protein MreC [Kiritimatiellae bacterium]|nr:rod shape-determining protein MreC [Kiritimatiellia bacterium]
MRFWIVLVGLGVGTLVFWRTGAFCATCETLYPYEKARVWFNRTVGVRAKALCSRVSHAARNQLLERDLARLQIEAARTAELERENARLRESLAYTQKAPPLTRCQSAAILSRGGTTAIWQTFRVSRGSLDGVRTGDPVIVPDGLVGRVSDVSPHTCDVMLISDPNSRVACELETQTDGLGVIRGILYGGGAKPGADPQLRLLYVIEPLRLRYLSRDFEPPPRTRIVTSGLGQTFPKGLTVGYLLESAISANGLSREAVIMPAVDLAGLEEVFILSAREGVR